jgi:hypothetical protein
VFGWGGADAAAAAAARHWDGAQILVEEVDGRTALEEARGHDEAHERRLREQEDSINALARARRAE